MPDNLALRMRPRSISEVIGQKHLVGEGKIIRRMVEANMLSSMILYGPPGIGKTSIASAIAGTTKFAFRTFNATVDSKKRLQEIAEEAKFSGGLVLLLDVRSPSCPPPQFAEIKARAHRKMVDLLMEQKKR